MAETNPVLEAVDKMQSDLTNQINEVKAGFDKQIEARVMEINEEVKKANGTLQDTLKEVNEMKKAQGKFKIDTPESKSFEQTIKDMVRENAEKISTHKKGDKFDFEVKSVQNMIVANTHTGDTAITQLNNVQARGMYPFHIRNLVGVVPTAYDTVNYAQAVAPVGEGSFGTQTQGSAKTQLDYDTKIVTLSLDTIAAYAKVSRQALRNIPFLESYLSSSLVEDYQTAEDVKVLNAIAASATAGSSAGANTVEKMIDYMVQILNLGYNPSSYLTTPAGWADILKTKPSDYSIPGGLLISPNGDILFAGLPIYKSAVVSTNRVYVGDWSKVKIAQSEAFNIRMSENDQDDFIKNLVTFRAEASIGVVELAPKAMVFGVW